MNYEKSFIHNGKSLYWTGDIDVDYTIHDPSYDDLFGLVVLPTQLEIEAVSVLSGNVYDEDTDEEFLVTGEIENSLKNALLEDLEFHDYLSHIILDQEHCI